MDADGFDSLARFVGMVVPRRAALGGLVTGGLTSLIPRIGILDAEAKKKRKRRKKKK